jgi:predicted PurR-regulated permease PerM
VEGRGSAGIPLPTILTTVVVVAAAYFAGQLVNRLRDVLLLLVVSGFVALLLNPLAVALQRWRVQRRGLAVAVVTFWGLVVFIGLAVAFGYPLANGITHLAHGLPTYVSDAEHGRGWIGHLASRYHVQNWVKASAPKLVSLGQGPAKPALSLGRDAFSLVLSLITIFALILLLLLEGPRMRSGLLNLVVFLVHTQIENHALNPVVMSRTVNVNPLLVLISILVGASIGSWVGAIFGAFVAALPAIPTAGALQVLIREIWYATAPQSGASAGAVHGD